MNTKLWVLHGRTRNVLLYGERNFFAVEPMPVNASYWMVPNFGYDDVR